MPRYRRGEAICCVMDYGMPSTFTQEFASLLTKMTDQLFVFQRRVYPNLGRSDLDETPSPALQTLVPAFAHA
jgi:hypothetical protein